MKKSNIKKYQNGGKNKLTQAELDLYNKYKAYVGSDIYLNRLKNFRTPQEAELEQYISLDRLKRAGIPVVSPVVLPNQIQGWYENPSVINGIGNIILSPRRDKYTYTHEMEHLNRSGGDRYNNAELSLLRGMNRSNSKLSKDQLDYLQDPRESGAKLSNLRSAAVELGIHQEFGEEFTEEQLQNLLEKVKENKSFKFIEAYNPKYLLQALNTIADRGERQVVPIAQNGGGYSWSNPSEGAATVTTPTRSQQMRSERKDLLDNEYKRRHTITEHEKFKSIPRDTINEIIPPKGLKLDDESLKKSFIEDLFGSYLKSKRYSWTSESVGLDKKTFDLYKDGKYNEAAEYIDESGELFNEFKDKMLVNALLSNELGVKEIRPTSLNRLKRITGKRPMFDFTNQIMYINYPDDIVKELGHAKQKKEGENIYNSYLKDWLKNPFITSTGYNRLYTTPNSFEHRAHKIIEPQIRSALSRMDSLLIGEYKNGGNSQNNTMKNTKFPTLGRFMYQQGGNIKKYQNGGNPQNNTMKNNKTYRGINKYQGGGSTGYDVSGFLGGLDTQFTDFLSQNPEFSNLDTNLKILPEKEWRKQNGYPEFFWPWESSKKREAEERYKAYVQSQKQGQESLKIAKPIGKALFQLDKVNETADLERTFGQKRDAYSLDDEVPQMAYRGFFQQGGAIREEVEDTEEENNNEEMVDGIIEMLRQIEDMDNRKRVAIQKLQELQKEGIQVDAEDFLEDVMEEEYEEEQDVENMKNGGIPQRYKNLGFTRVGQKKNSTREGKKWMVLAKKGDKYKVVHGGAAGMSDYTKHGDKERRERFWKRHNAGAPGKSRDPFSPLYWHKKFGTWEQGGSVKLESLNKYFQNGGTPFEMEDYLKSEDVKNRFVKNYLEFNPKATQEDALKYAQKEVQKRLDLKSSLKKEDFGSSIDFKDQRARDIHAIKTRGYYNPETHSYSVNPQERSKEYIEYHEQHHGSNKGDVTREEKLKLFELLNPGAEKYRDENYRYLEYNTDLTKNYTESPEEMAARLYELRQYAHKKKIWNAGKNITPEALEEAYKAEDDDVRINEIKQDLLKRANISEDDPERFRKLSNLWNSFVSADTNNMIYMAQNGGRMGQGTLKQQMMGYKDNSPYKNLPYQDFFTNRLTMNGVSRPILALPDKGQPRVMLPNSGIYEFPLANQVREIPLAQDGLQPTRRDSLDIYNNNQALLDYFVKSKNYKEIKSPGQGLHNQSYLDRIWVILNDAKEDYKNPDNVVLVPTKDGSAEKIKSLDNIDLFYKEIDKNKFKIRDVANNIVDTRAPIQLFDRRITPTRYNEYANLYTGNPLVSDVVNLYSYDPALIIPEDMISRLTPEQREQREKYKQSPAYFKALQRQGILQPRPKINVNSLPTEITELPTEQPQINLELSGRIRPGFLAKGEIKQASPSIPNVDIIFEKRGNQRIPVFLQNQLGQRIPYNEAERGEVDLRAFQYPGFKFKNLNGGMISKFQNSGQPTLENQIYNLTPKQKEEYVLELLSYMDEVGEEKMKKLAPKEYSFLVNYMAEQGQGNTQTEPDYDMEAPVLPEIEKTGERIYTDDLLRDVQSRLNLEITPSEEYEYRRKVEEINNRILDAMSKTPPRSTIQSTSLNEGLRQILNQGITNPKVPYAKNGFFSRLGRGIGKVARGVGNAFHDWGMMIADSAGNNLGIYDIDNERYKTRFGRGLAGVNDQLQSVTGKIGKAVASAAVPGMSGVFNMPGNIGAAMNQQPMQQPAFNQYQQPQGGNYNQMQMLMNFLPYLSNSFQGSPMFNQGGRINLTGMYNPYSQLPNDYYMQGGTVKSGLITDSDAHNKKKGPGVSYPKRGPMGPKGYNYSTGRREVQDYATFNEYIPTENLIPIQTEKDELIVLPTGDISPVMATKRHSRMREDEVTDVTPEGSYILSAHGDVRIYKDEANSVITEMGIKPYRLGYGQEKPTEKTLADFMHKNKMTPAEIGAKVMKQFPIWKTNNIFEASANDQNKINRRPYLEGLIQLSELDRYRKGLVQPEQMRNGGGVFRKDIMSYPGGGGTSGTGGTPWGEIAGIGGALVQGLFSMAAANQQRREANRAYRDITNLVNQSTGTQANLMGMGAGMGIAGTLAQDPTVDWAQLDPSYIRQMEYRTPMGIRESMANRAYANRPDYMRFAPNFASGVSAEQAAYAQALKQGYDSEISLFDKDRAARNQYLSAIQGYQDKNEASRIDALNAMRLNRNQMIGNVGDRGQGLFDSRAILEANRAQSLAGARLGQLAAQQQAIKSQNQALNNIIGSATLGAQSYLNNRTNPTQPIYQPPQGFQPAVDNPPCIDGVKTYIDPYTQERFKIRC